MQSQAEQKGLSFAQRERLARARERETFFCECTRTFYSTKFYTPVMIRPTSPLGIGEIVCQESCVARHRIMLDGNKNWVYAPAFPRWSFEESNMEKKKRALREALEARCGIGNP